MLNKHLISKYITPLSPLPTSLNQSGNLKENIKCLLFDVYGTLFISGSGDIGIAKKNLKETEKLDQLLVKFKISKNSGTILRDFFACIEKKHKELREKGVDFPEVEIDRIWMNVLKNNNMDTVREFALLFELIVNPVYPMPHLKELLSACKERKIPIGIISNAQFYTPYLFNWFLDSDMEELGFYSDLIIFSYRFGYAKPSIFLFQVAAEKLKNMDITANSALYIGNDMLKDIYPAKKAGFKTALFAGDARSLRLRQDNQECKNLSPDLVITDLIQLLDYI